jgi:hypothetical protein
MLGNARGVPTPVPTSARENAYFAGVFDPSHAHKQKPGSGPLDAGARGDLGNKDSHRLFAREAGTL